MRRSWAMLVRHNCICGVFLGFQNSAAYQQRLLRVSWRLCAVRWRVSWWLHLICFAVMAGLLFDEDPVVPLRRRQRVFRLRINLEWPLPDQFRWVPTYGYRPFPVRTFFMKMSTFALLFICVQKWNSGKFGLILFSLNSSWVLKVPTYPVPSCYW